LFRLDKPSVVYRRVTLQRAPLAGQ